MNIIIRADASIWMGSGHVMRCLTLAVACRKRGARVRFVCREHPGNLIDLIISRGFEVRRLAAIQNQEAGQPSGQMDWLGVSLEQDARETRAAIAEEGGHVDWLVIDQYGIDVAWQRQLRDSVDRIMVIDDLANRPHDCDLLLDQNFRQVHEGRYAALVNAQCVMAMGPRFALLQEDYAEWRQRVTPRTKVQRVLVYFGGVDAAGLTGISIRAALTFPQLHVDAVVSALDAAVPALRDLAAAQPRLTLHISLPSLAPLMAVSDLAIGAFGATSWERLCLGLPTIAVSLANNQNGVATELSDVGLALWVGSPDGASEDRFASAIDKVMRETDLADWSERCMAICDGRGTDRVVDMLWTGTGESAYAKREQSVGHL